MTARAVSVTTLHILCCELPQVSSEQVEPAKQPTGPLEPEKRVRNSPNIKSYFSTHAECEGAPSAKRQRRESQGELKGGQYPHEVVEVCKECGEQVPVWLVGEHSDYHLALQLQEDRTKGELVPVVAERRGQGRRHTDRKSMTIDKFFCKK